MEKHPLPYWEEQNKDSRREAPCQIPLQLPLFHEDIYRTPKQEGGEKTDGVIILDL